MSYATIVENPHSIKALKNFQRRLVFVYKEVVLLSQRIKLFISQLLQQKQIQKESPQPPIFPN